MSKMDWKTITFRSLFLFIFVNFLGIRVQITQSIIPQTFTTSSSHPVLRAFGFASSLPLLARVCFSWCVTITCRWSEYLEYIGRMYSVTHVIVKQKKRKWTRSYKNIVPNSTVAPLIYAESVATVAVK